MTTWTQAIRRYSILMSPLAHSVLDTRKRRSASGPRFVLGIGAPGGEDAKAAQNLFRGAMIATGRALLQQAILDDIDAFGGQHYEDGDPVWWDKGALLVAHDDISDATAYAFAQTALLSSTREEATIIAEAADSVIGTADIGREAALAAIHCRRHGHAEVA
jgi:hypothetical protein